LRHDSYQPSGCHAGTLARLLAWLLVLSVSGLPCRVAAAGPVPLFGPALADTPAATYQRADDENAPPSYAALPAWLEAHKPLPKVDMLGGDFWLLARFSPTQPTTAWSVAFANTWYRRAVIVILGDDGSRQEFAVGQHAERHLMFYHGVEVRLDPGHDYAILVGVSTPFFTSLPRIDIETLAQYRQRHANETVLTIATLGLLCGLGVFVFFIGLWIRDRSYLLYGCQALVLALGWGFFFGLPTGWLDVDTGRWNFTLWFIVLPIVHAMFTVRFLALKRHAPWLAHLGYGIAAVSVLMLPVALLFPSLAFQIATALVSVVVLYSTIAGLWALGHGVRQARFFTLAFLGVLLPGLVILPANFGLVPDAVDNSDLLTLLGCGCEALLLAFALADHVKLLNDARERFRKGMQDAVAKASVDALTGLGNRLAFNVLIEEITNQPSPDPAQGAVQVAMIDLDGLKHVNDSQGHARGDELLRAAGTGLAHLVSDRTRVFRLGGDEFAVVAYGDDLSLQRLSKSLAELDRGLREGGFANAGISFGLSSAPATRRRTNGVEIAELVRQADRAMYAQKTRRRNTRASGQPMG
jgi:diguanylate cyclase (GGDEF)-like protein